MTIHTEAALEDRIRRRAHQIWLDEGRPDGHADRHWQAARQLVAEETEQDGTLIPLEASREQASEPLFTAEAHGDLPGVMRDQGEDRQFPDRDLAQPPGASRSTAH